MGTTGQDFSCNPPPPPLKDLKVKFHHTTLVCPVQETEKRSFYLSNIDQILNFYVPTVHFFSPDPDFPLETVAKRLETALQKVLVPYDFVAGRLRLNHQLGRIEVDCNAAGVGLVIASSEYSLHEIGNLDYPNPGFQQLAVQSLDNVDPNDQPLCIFQLTSFTCGGFCMGWSDNHALFDGASMKTILENIASQTFESKPMPILPFNDRHLLDPRSPPRVSFPHPEILKIDIAAAASLPLCFDIKKEELDYKVFRMSSSQIDYLKEKAKANYSDTEDTTAAKITTFIVVAALVWRCRALSADIEDKERSQTLLYPVDIRSKMNPPLPPSYTGNAVLNGYASAKVSELEKAPFSDIVGVVSSGATRLTDEYIRSTLDLAAMYKAFPNGDYMISTWWKLGFEQVVYAWGKPIYSGPVVNHRKDISLFYPDIVDNDAMNVLVSLPAKELERFQSLFHEFLG